jgi:hypothetical protein
MPGKLIYKCRLCGDHHRPTGVPNLLTALVAMVTNTPVPEEWDSLPIAIEPLQLHSCADGRVGVSDLIGGEYNSI